MSLSLSPVLLIFTLIASYLYYVQGESACTTPSGSIGQCITISQCKPLLALINKSNPTKKDLELLKKARCGLEDSTPEVCKDNMLNRNNSKCQVPEHYRVCCDPESTVGPVRRHRSVPTGVCEPTYSAPDPSTGCCGKDASSGNRIIGGTTTSIDEYPWLALIEYKYNDEILLLCGGALISGMYVLTAGHCVSGAIIFGGTPTNVRLGEFNITNDGSDCENVAGDGMDCTEGIVVIPIEDIIMYPDYNPLDGKKRHDIALLKLRTLAPYTDFIRPICLPTMDWTASPPPKFTMYAAGWGVMDTKNNTSDVKLHVDLPLVQHEQCQSVYNGARELWQKQVCAGGQKGKDSCKGDSGGPLMYKNSWIYEVIGIVSYGPTPCGLKDVPGVYTNVYEYNEWIRSQMRP